MMIKSLFILVQVLCLLVLALGASPIHKLEQSLSPAASEAELAVSAEVENDNDRALITTGANAKGIFTNIEQKLGIISPTFPNMKLVSFTSVGAQYPSALSADAQFSMILCALSYNALSAAQKGTPSQTAWLQALAAGAAPLKKGGFAAQLKSLTVGSSDQDLGVLVQTTGKSAIIYAGGHGSATWRDWLGQNTDLSGIVGDIGTWINKLGAKVKDPTLGTKVTGDIQARGARLNTMVNGVIANLKGKGISIQKIVVFGHSMAGAQGGLATTLINKANPQIPIHGYLLNPGGPTGSVVSSITTNYVVPGEILSVIGIGANNDHKAIPLLFHNPNAANLKSSTASVYLHSAFNILNDINAIYA